MIPSLPSSASGPPSPNRDKRLLQINGPSMTEITSAPNFAFDRLYTPCGCSRFLVHYRFLTDCNPTLTPPVNDLKLTLVERTSTTRRWRCMFPTTSTLCQQTASTQGQATSDATRRWLNSGCEAEWLDRSAFVNGRGGEMVGHSCSVTCGDIADRYSASFSEKRYGTSVELGTQQS